MRGGIESDVGLPGWCAHRLPTSSKPYDLLMIQHLTFSKPYYLHMIQHLTFSKPYYLRMILHVPFSKSYYLHMIQHTCAPYPIIYI